MSVLIAVTPLFTGFILDLIIGDPYRLPHPVRLMGKTITELERALRRIFKRKEKAAGAVMAAIMLILSAAVPPAILIPLYRINIWLGAAAESVMCFYTIAAKSLKTESMKVYGALRSGDIEAARKAVSMIVGRDTDKLDEAGIIKAAVETVAENTSDGVCAPMLYTALFGPALGFMYKAANTMDSMVGYKNEKYISFGYAAAKIDDVLNYIPSRLTAVMMIAAAYMSGFDGENAKRIWRRDKRSHASPNAAQTESVCAGALDIELAGDAYYSGALYKKPTIGDDIRPVEIEDIRRANRLMYITSWICLAFSIAVRAVLAGLVIL